MGKKFFSKKKHKDKNNSNEYHIVKLFKEIENELGEAEYKKLQEHGIDRNILEKIENIVFEKYIDSVDIIKLNLKNYIRNIEPRNNFFQPSNFINITLALFALFWSMICEIKSLLDLVNCLSSIPVLILICYLFKLFDKNWKDNKKFELANILLDIIDMNESKVTQ